MTPARWQQIDELLDEVLELPVEERRAFLAQACKGDEELRQQVEQVLAGQEGADAIFENSPAGAIAEVLRDQTITALGGQKVGPYQILNEIGRGGMGVVYRAVRADDEYSQQVAIKLVWPGPHNTELLRRFRRERQILANLDHPHIARLLDGGRTEQGWPYLVMEYIEGAPITEYCRQRDLPLRDRLALFRDVCSAVQYAHQNLVIHRDLKPGNILVTDVGEAKLPKLLDFGIAKLLDAQRHHMTAHSTLAGAQLMTPEYASPEQVRAEPITTASDVYSLGVLLYELLTGQSPYRFKSHTLPEIIRTVCEDEPLPPRTVASASDRTQLKGDLDTIVLTALSKEISRRYASVEQLSEDLRRHLAGEPILARTGTFSYHASKFVRRNKLGVTAAAIVLLTLIGGIIGTSWQARIAQQHAQDNRRLLYAAQMNLAGQAWQASNVARTEELVEANRPRDGEEDLRGFEWYYLWRLYHQNRALTLQHPNEVWSVTFSPDGQTIATGCNDGLARLWNADTGQEITGQGLKALGKNYAKIHSVAFSPNGKNLLASGDDPHVKLWEATTGKHLLTFHGNDDNVLSARFSPDGNWLVAGDSSPNLYLVQMTRPSFLTVLSGHSDAIGAIAFSPDGKTIATGSFDTQVKIWAMPKLQTTAPPVGTLRRVFPIRFDSDDIWEVIWSWTAKEPIAELAPTKPIAILNGHTAYIHDAAFSPDGQRLMTSDFDGAVKIWETATWKELFTFKAHESAVKAAAFSPNGKLLATGGDDRLVRLWNTATWQQVGEIKGHGGRVLSLAFSPDGGRLATASDDHTVKVWDVATGSDFYALRSHRAEVNTVAFSPDGKMLASAGDDFTAKLWDVATQQELVTLKGHTDWIRSVTFSPDGKILATGSRDLTAKLWDTATGREIATLLGTVAEGGTSIGAGHVLSVAFSPNGRFLVTGQEDHTIRIWDVISRKEIGRLTNHKRRITSVAFSPDGKLLASGGEDLTVRLWDFATRREINKLTGHTGEIWSVAFSPDGETLATTGDDRNVKLWDTATWRERANLKAHADSVRSLAFSPDGRRLATASKDHTVKLWDMATNQELITLTGHTAEVWGVAFSPDGLTLATASGDQTVRLWSAATAQEVAAQRAP